MRFRKPNHPAEAALVALAAGDELPSRALLEHVRRCALCTTRVAELRRVRALLCDAAAFEEAPRRDLARGAMRRLQRRQTTISHVNEFFGAFFAIVRGLRTLLAVDDTPPSGSQRG